MSVLPQMEPTRVWVEVTTAPPRLYAWCGGDGVEIPLDREPGGPFTAATVAGVTAAIQRLTSGKPWLSRLHIHCTLGSRGVILRPVSFPAQPRSEWASLLALQLESEFPLSPEQLAWGWLPLPSREDGRQMALLAAVKLDLLQPYRDLLAPLEAEVHFSLAALDRLALLTSLPDSGVVLDVGEAHVEATLWSADAPLQVRTLSKGWKSWPETALGGTDGPLREFLTSLSVPAGTPLFLSLSPLNPEGGSPTVDSLAKLVEAGKGASGMIQPLPFVSGIGRTAANVGLANRVTRADASHLELRSTPAPESQAALRGLPWRAIALTGALLAAILITPSVEALVFGPRLQRQLNHLKAAEPQLAVIDRELNFLRHLQENQGPFLDAIYLIANAAPMGCHVDSLSLNRRGEVGVTGFLQNLNQVGDFRMKLIDTGFFSSVVVEDQTPTPDRQRVNFRMTAQWKAASDRESLTIGPTLTNAVPSGATNANSRTQRPPSAP